MWLYSTAKNSVPTIAISSNLVHVILSEEGGSNLGAIKMNYTKPFFCKNYIV